MQGNVGGSPESIRLALRGRRHERLMKAAYVLSAPANCERVALHEQGNYSVQVSSQRVGFDWAAWKATNWLRCCPRLHC